MREQSPYGVAPQRCRATMEEDLKTGGGPGGGASSEDDGWIEEVDTAVVMRRGEPWVQRIARSLVRRLRLGPEHFEELQAAGRLGLLEAYRQYDRGHASRAKFSTFAYAIVRRHVQDVVSGIRNLSPGIYRSAKRKAAEERAARSDITQVYTEDYILPILRLGAEGVFEDRFAETGRQVEGNAIRQTIERLPDRQQRQVLRLMYVKGLEQGSVGAALGLRKARVSRIRKAALETFGSLMVIGNALDENHIGETLSRVDSEAHREVLETLYGKGLDYAKAREDLGLSAKDLEVRHQAALRVLAACVERAVVP